jgi:hypothetical protein
MSIEKKPVRNRVVRGCRNTLGVGMLLLCIPVILLYHGYKPAWQFDTLEFRARRVITGVQLQNWATNFIAQHPTNTQVSFRLSELGTNFPPQLRDLAPRLGPNVVLYQWADAGQPPSILIWWGSGFLGAKGFEIGPTNFVGRGHEWQRPGVYFFGPN